MTELELNLAIDQATDLHPETPLSVDMEDSAKSVIDAMRMAKKGVALVNKSGKLAGIFTERDVMRLFAEDSDLSLPIKQYMGRNVIYLKRNESVATAVTKMAEGGYRRLPLVDQNGTATAVISTNGILHYLVEHFPETIYNLPPSTSGTTRNREGA